MKDELYAYLNHFLNNKDTSISDEIEVAFDNVSIQMNDDLTNDFAELFGLDDETASRIDTLTRQLSSFLTLGIIYLSSKINE